VEKYSRAGQAEDENMAHAYFSLRILGYKHILSICNTYCFSTATMFARTRLSVTLHVPCLYSVCDKSPQSRFLPFNLLDFSLQVINFGVINISVFRYS
jgi:hypothetical protein